MTEETKHAGGRPLKFESVEELDAAIDAYFARREADSLPLTMSGLAVALGVDRKTLINYAKKDEFFHSLSRAKARCEDFAESQLFIGRNPSGASFALTNNYDWANKQDTTIRFPDGFGEGSDKQLLDEYAKGN